MYRCGYCGTPTDEHGVPLNNCSEISESELDNATLTQGECCREQEEEKYVIITRDMAIDAGDPSLEGQRWKW
jgi:hypothetical protein